MDAMCYQVTIQFKVAVWATHLDKGLREGIWIHESFNRWRFSKEMLFADIEEYIYKERKPEVMAGVG